MLKLVRAVLLVLPFLGALIVRADEKPLRLDPSQPMTKYAIASWRDTSGLPVDSVPALAQTRDGYLWAGTEHGLVRFDGVRFTTFNTANTPELRSNEIFTLFVSSDGLLWIGTRGGGAVTYDGTSFRRVPIRYRYIGAFAESADGAVWIGAPGGVVRAFGGRYTVFEKNQGYPGGYLLAMAGDADGVYIAMPSGVIRVGDGRSRVWSTAEGLSGGTVTALTWTDGGLLAGDQNGNLYRLRGDRFQRTLRLESGHAISSIHEGAAGSLWLSTIGGGLVRYHNGVVDRLAERDGLTSDSINLVIEDHEGSMWAGTTGGGLVQIKAARLTTIEPRQPLSGEWVLSLSQARDGSVWFGTNGAGVNRLEGESLTRVAVPQGLLQEVITAIGEDSEGGIWVGSNGGLQRVAGGRVVKTMTAADGLEGRRALAITASARGGVWVSTEKGLHYVPPRGRATRLTEKDGVTPGYIVSIREAGDGSLWLGRPGAVEHVRDRKVTRFTREHGLQSRTVTSLAIDEVDGSVWVATMADGLFRIRNGTIARYTEADGLLTNSVYGVVQDRSGDLWIPTGRGLFTIKRTALDRFEKGAAKKIAIATFRKADGLKSSDFSGGFDRPGFRGADGNLWFPTTRGLVVVEPEKLRTDQRRPRVVIEEVVANGTHWRLPLPPIAPPSGNREIEFAYSAPAFYAPEGIAFQYKLEGFDDAWREAGKRRTAYYTNVPPGRYRFLVRATSAEGLMSEAASSLVVEPRFFETWRFRIAASLLVLLAIMVIDRRRVESIQRHQDELERSEEHFRSLIENASDMIIEIGIDGCVSYASPSVQRVLGLRPYSINGRELADVLTSREAGEAFLAAVRERGSHAATLPFRDAAGALREVEVSGATSESRRNIVLNCRDITDRRRLESQLAQANRLSSLGRLAATVSHEFNNVLMGIQPFVDIIRRKSEEPRVQDAASQIAGTVKRGKRITEEILRYTRPVEPTLAPVPLRGWLVNLETELRALAGPNVRMSIIAPEGLTVSADVSQLSQVLINMALNARDAGATTVRFEGNVVDGDGRFAFGIVSTPERFAHLRVSDNGSGISASVLPHIFEPLFTTKTSRGTGLGLAVAQQIVSRHGGEIFVESKVGAGTTFHIFLPIAVSEAGELLAGDETLPVRAPSCRLLLVEDDSVVAAGILTLLEDDGFTTALAVTGGEALSMIPRFAPDVVVLDVGLPDIDGTEVYRRILSRWPKLPVIFSTGHGDMDTVRSLASPHPPLLLKPYGIDTLSATVATLLQSEKSVA